MAREAREEAVLSGDLVIAGLAHCQRVLFL